MRRLRARVRFEVTSSSLDLSRLIDMLGAEGDVSWSKGKELFYGAGKTRKRKFTLWCIEISADSTTEIETLIGRILSRLEPISENIRAASRHIDTSLCLWLDWYPGDVPFGIHINRRVISVLDSIGAELDIDTSIYCPDDI